MQHVADLGSKEREQRKTLAQRNHTAGDKIQCCLLLNIDWSLVFQEAKYSREEENSLLPILHYQHPYIPQTQNQVADNTIPH